MSFFMDWYIEKRILFSVWPAIISWEDWEQINARACEFLDAGTAPVYVITDATQVTKFPVNIARGLRVFTGASHPSMGLSLLITKNPALNGLLNVVPGKQRGVASVEAALRLLEEHDDTLDWSQANDSVLETPSQ